MQSRQHYERSGQQFEERWNAFDQWRRKQLSKIVFIKLYRVLFLQYKKDSIDKARNKMGTFHKLQQYNAATPQSWFTPVGWVEWRQYAGSPPHNFWEWQHYTAGVGSAQKL